MTQWNNAPAMIGGIPGDLFLVFDVEHVEHRGQNVTDRRCPAVTVCDLITVTSGTRDRCGLVWLCLQLVLTLFPTALDNDKTLCFRSHESGR